MKPTEILFFPTPRELQQWFARHHLTVEEVWIGFHKKGSGRPSITWPESVDEALCVGWIDGLRKSMDEHSYKIRFTPRRRGSIWSAVNIRRVEVLTAEGRMRERGLQAFAARIERRSGIYSYEQRTAQLAEPYATLFQQHPKAWALFQAQPASYRKAACWWVVTAKQETTRLRRLDQLIADSAAGRRIKHLTPIPPKPKLNTSAQAAQPHLKG